MACKHWMLAVLLLTTLLSSCAQHGMVCNNSCTDNNITTNVLVKLNADRCMSDQFMRVTTYERVVTITGRVSNPTQKQIATNMATSVPGVKRVKNKLVIRPLYY